MGACIAPVGLKVTHEWIHANAEADRSTSSALARTGSVRRGLLRVRIEPKRLRSITPTKLRSGRPRVVPDMVRIPDGRAERLVERCSSSLDAGDRGGDVEEHQDRPAAEYRTRWSSSSSTSKAWTPHALTTTIPESRRPWPRSRRELATTRRRQPRRPTSRADRRTATIPTPRPTIELQATSARSRRSPSRAHLLMPLTHRSPESGRPCIAGWPPA